MIAKYNGFCKVTSQPIIAGVTSIQKVNGKWQVAAGSKPNSPRLPSGATIIVVDGPHADIDKYGDEFGYYSIDFCDDDAEPVSDKFVKVSDFDGAVAEGERLAAMHKIDVEIFASQM